VILPQISNQEFRATWVITWHHISSGASIEENQARVREIMDDHVAANMNAVIFQVRQNGTAYYNSSFEPWGSYAGGSDPGYDPLTYAIEQAHARGLELHAWMNTFESRGAATGTPAQVHPEWVCRDGNGNPMPANHALSPGLPAVRSYLVDVAMEMVNNYDIDGIHLDYVRWNEYTTSSVTASPLLAKGIPQEESIPDGMVTQAQLEALQAAAPQDRYLYDSEHPYSETPPDSVGGGQFPSWEDFWRWAVTEFVHTLHDSIRSVKPWVRLSTAALGNYNWGGWQGYGTVFQDAALWFNQEYIDQLTPMHYHWTDSDGFLYMLRNNTSGNWEDHIQPGIDAGRLYTVGPGSYYLSEANRWGNHASIIDACRTIAWVDGFQFFSFGSWASHDYWEKAGATFFGSKTKVRGTGLIVADPPPAPSLGLNRLDSLTYELAVTPPGALEGTHRFAIYRSEDALIDTADDRIVDIHFGNDPYTFTDQYTGTQDFNGAYTYGVTTLDRYWNESAISNTEITDPVPSLPPVIVATSPMEGDTIPVNSTVSLTFSKTIDTTTFTGAVSIEPLVTLQDIAWEDDWASTAQTVTLSFASHLLHDTDYTLVLDATLQDVNGVPLDGNGDGIGGDPDTLRFHTEPPDIIGPVVLASYPNAATPPDSILRDEVVTLVFNEHLDHSSFTDASVLLTQNVTPIESHYKLTDVPRRTVLSIQPVERNFPAGTSFNLTVGQEITDSVGNPMAADINLAFATSYYWKTQEVVLDNFLSTVNWEQPDYSGSTVGIDGPASSFGLSSNAYLPSSITRQRSSARLHYKWLDADSLATFLLRDYLSGAPRNIAFDTSWVLQCFVFSDGSNNEFRFALDDGYGDATNHEVSQWITLDWYGWRLVEWDLSDPGSFGEWLGNQQWDNPTNLHFDSFQLTHIPGSSRIVGDVYFDNLRLVKQDYLIQIAETEGLLPDHITLGQNYPNPFNAVTNIPFYLPVRRQVEVTIYNLKGQPVKTLLRGDLPAGEHLVTWRGETGKCTQAASGIYIIRLQSENHHLTRQMLLVK
ncbi:MAG: family 10 glycosylhydrolase, partial [Fidelibacterota bacterium]